MLKQGKIFLHDKFLFINLVVSSITCKMLEAVGFMPRTTNSLHYANLKFEIQ